MARLAEHFRPKGCSCTACGRTEQRAPATKGRDEHQHAWQNEQKWRNRPEKTVFSGGACLTHGTMSITAPEVIRAGGRDHTLWTYAQVMALSLIHARCPNAALVMDAVSLRNSVMHEWPMAMAALDASQNSVHRLLYCGVSLPSLLWPLALDGVQPAAL